MRIAYQRTAALWSRLWIDALAKVHYRPSVLLPNGTRAAIDPEKVRGYLLSSSHPVGRFKASFFLALGYTSDKWVRLRDDLLTIAATAEAKPGKESLFGQKFETRATLVGPAGRSAAVLAVWIIATGEETPRFVTAFPG